MNISTHTDIHLHLYDKTHMYMHLRIHKQASSKYCMYNHFDIYKQPVLYLHVNMHT